MIGAITEGFNLSGPFSETFQRAKEAVAAATNTVKDTVGNAVESATSPMSWVKEFFSANTAARAIGAVIGIVLIGLAIYVLITATDVQKLAAAKG